MIMALGIMKSRLGTQYFLQIADTSPEPIAVCTSPHTIVKGLSTYPHGAKGVLFCRSRNEVSVVPRTALVGTDNGTPPSGCSEIVM